MVDGAGTALALGYEGPVTIGTLAAAAAILLGTVMLAWLVIRGLVLFVSNRLNRPPRSHRPR